MKSVRERVTEYSKGDNLDLFWRLFRLRYTKLVVLALFSLEC